MADNGKQQDNRLVKAYERMLQRLAELLNGPGGSGIRDSLSAVKRRAVELGELTREEAERIGEYLRRDIEQAADYMARTDKDYATWLHMDLQLIENWVWDSFVSVADRTRVELLQFQQPLPGAEEYRTGEIAAPGALTCLSCGNTITFRQTAHIPPCPRCRNTRFMRTAAYAPPAEDQDEGG